MLSKGDQEKPAVSAPSRKLSSVPVWMADRAFNGEFELNGKTYRLNFIPGRAEVAGGKLRLRGRMIINDGGAGLPEQRDIAATLAAVQGGVVGRGPARHKLLAGRPNVKMIGVPTEATGPLSFTAAMFLRLDPLDEKRFGLAADLSQVQLNVRLAPKEPVEQELHSLYCALIDMVAGESPDPGIAALLLKELNQVLAG